MRVEVVPGLEACLRGLASQKLGDQHGILICASQTQLIQVLHAFPSAASCKQQALGAFPLRTGQQRRLLKA